MHELSIALHLVEAACEALDRSGEQGEVAALHLRLGALSGVVKDSLLFSFDVAVEGTPLAGARLEIEEVPVTVFCPQCAAERRLAGLQRFRCPVCATPTADVRGGRELELRALELAVPAAAGG